MYLKRRRLTFAQVVRLRCQNENLQRALASEKAKSTEAQARFMQGVTGLLQAYTQQHHDGLSRMTTEAVKGNQTSEQQILRFEKSLNASCDANIEREESFGQDLESAWADSKSIHSGGVKVSIMIIRDARKLMEVSLWTN